LARSAEYLRGALAGRYRESVRLTDGELAKAREVLETEDAEVRIFSSNVGTIGRRVLGKRSLTTRSVMSV
jgi:hypothetical protein